MPSVRLTLRGRHAVAGFFDGLKPIGPGLVAGTEWLTLGPAGLALLMIERQIALDGVV
jgi:hypothetical protein